MNEVRTMAITDSTPTSTVANPRLVVPVVGIALLAAFGSLLVILGLTDLLAYLVSYRPTPWIAYDFVTALTVTTVGWAFFVAAFISTVRVALARR